MNKTRTVFTYDFSHFNNFKKVHTKPHTFFYVPPNTHITPFHTNNIFKSNNVYKNHPVNPKQTFLLP